MGIVAEFAESGDPGWDVSRAEFLTTILDELPDHPSVAVIMHGTVTALVNRNYVKVKVVTPNDNGNPAGNSE